MTHSPSRVGPLRLAVAGGLAGALVLVGLGAAPPAAAADCGAPTRWTGLGDGHSWTDAANWDAGAPTETGSATVDVAAAIDGVAGTTCGLLVQAPEAGVALSGALSLTGDASLSGPVSWTGLLSSSQSLSLLPTTRLQLGDATVVAVDGQGTIGAGVVLDAADGVATPPVLRISGSGSADSGTVHLDGVGLELVERQGGAGSLDLKAATVTVDGSATSRLAAGSTVLAASQGGVLVLGTGASLVVVTGAAVQLPAVLRVAGATFGGGGVPATLAGNGTLSWQSGTLDGDLSLGLPTTLDGGGTRSVPGASTLRNANQVNVADGTLDLRGTLVNGGGVQLRPGVVVSGAGDSPSLLRNLPGATVRVEPVANGGQVVLDGVHLTNEGTLSVPTKSRLVLGSSGTQTTSDLLDGGTVSNPDTATATTDQQGILQVAQGATLRLAGATTLAKTTLLLDDPIGNGATARLEAGSAVATLKSAELGGGAFSWRSGTVAGAVTIDKLTTEVLSTHEGSRRLLEGQDAAHPGLLSLGGNATLHPTVLSLGAKAKLAVTGALTLASSPGGISPLAELDGQQVVVATGGSLSRVAQSTTPNGSSNSTGPMTVAVPLVNNGAMTLSTSLNVPAGLTQDVAANAPSGADAPVLGVFGSAVLSGSNGTSAVAPITLVRGGLGGTGTVEANPLTTGTGFLHPGTSSTTGTLTVKGDVVLGSGTDLQIVMRVESGQPMTHDKLLVQPLVVGPVSLQGSIALKGNLSGFSQSYNPAYGTTVADVVVAKSRSGSFTSFDSSGLSNGYGWRPLYPAQVSGQDAKVNLVVTDTSPPAIGIAGNPAFTQLTSQRFTYSAVDNKTGVSTFDVRWQQATPTSGFGGWSYPAGWQGTRSTSQVLSNLVPGRTYCFSVRARDRGGNVSGWSQPLCTAKMMDDRALSASAGWTRPGGASGFYFSTYSRTLRSGSYLRRSGTFTRVAVTAQRCPGCGNVLVYSGSTRIGSFSLNGTAGLTSWVSPVLTSRTAVVTLKVASAGKGVTIDGFGLAR